MGSDETTCQSLETLSTYISLYIFADAGVLKKTSGEYRAFLHNLLPWTLLLLTIYPFFLHATPEYPTFWIFCAQAADAFMHFQALILSHKCQSTSTVKLNFPRWRIYETLLLLLLLLILIFSLPLLSRLSTQINTITWGRIRKGRICASRDNNFNLLCIRVEIFTFSRATKRFL